MFTVSYRDEVREKIISRAKTDVRIISAAVIGSYARGSVDRWSDIDLTFGIDKLHPIAELLTDWTEYIVREYSGVVLLDVERGSTIYRVFLLPGCLQLDLSFSPHDEFGPVGQHFQLLYGKQYDISQPKGQSTSEIFGWMIHHILRARFCVERNRLWQAEFWISEARNNALKLACISRRLNPDYGRGFDDLPGETLTMFKGTFIISIEKKELTRVIQNFIEILPKISDEVKQKLKSVSSILDDLNN